MKQSEVTFLNWVKAGLRLLGCRPGVWLSYLLVMTVLLSVGRISLALGIILSTVSFLMTVSMAAYVDPEQSNQSCKVFIKMMRSHLPVAFSMAVMLALCWLVFRAIFNVYSGEPEKIMSFFFDWQLVDQSIFDQGVREYLGWLFRAAIVTLIFLVLMLTSFVSWFSYPLMTCQGFNWVQAKHRGKAMTQAFHGVCQKQLAFSFFLAIVGTGLFPLLTPLIYIVVGVLLYASFADISRHYS